MNSKMRKALIASGELRVCNCGFESLDRTEFRAHTRKNIHTQNLDGRKEAKPHDDRMTTL
jgi:hypothetical protein